MKNFVQSRFALGLGTFLVGVAITLAVVWGYTYLGTKNDDGVPYRSAMEQIEQQKPQVGASIPSHKPDVPTTKGEDYRNQEAQAPTVKDYWGAPMAPTERESAPDTFAGRVGKNDRDVRKLDTRKFFFPDQMNHADIMREFEEQQKQMDQLMQQFFADRGNPFDDPFFKRRDNKKEESDSNQRPNNRQRDPFFSPFRFGFGGNFAGANKVSIDQRADDRFVYVEIHSKYLDKESIQVEVENDMISVSGKMRVENERNGAGGSSRSVVISSFHQSFPVPADADPAGMQLENAPDKLILKFPRLSTT